MASHEDFSTVERLQAMRKPTVVTQLRDPVDRVLSAYEFAVEVALRNLKGKPRRVEEQQAPDGKRKRKVETTDVYPWSEVVPWMREYLRKNPVLRNADADSEDSDDALNANNLVDSYNNTFLMPLHDFIQQQVVVDHIHNGATVQFAGLTTRSLHEEWQTMRNCSSLSSKNNELLLQLAMHRLQSFAFVGLTERIDDNGRLMAAMRGYDLARPSPEVEMHDADRKKGSISDRYHQCVEAARAKYKRNRENTFKGMNLPFRFSKEARQSISQATLDLIRQYNQLDTALHTAAKGIYEMKIASLGRPLQEYPPYVPKRKAGVKSPQDSSSQAGAQEHKPAPQRWFKPRSAATRDSGRPVHHFMYRANSTLACPNTDGNEVMGFEPQSLIDCVETCSTQQGCNYVWYQDTNWHHAPDTGRFCMGYTSCEGSRVAIFPGVVYKVDMPQGGDDRLPLLNAAHGSSGFKPGPGNVFPKRPLSPGVQPLQKAEMIRQRMEAKKMAAHKGSISDIIHHPEELLGSGHAVEAADDF